MVVSIERFVMMSGLRANSNKYGIDSDSYGLKESVIVLKDTSAIIATGKDSRHMRPRNHIVEVLEPPSVGKPLELNWVGSGLEVVRTRVSGGNRSSPCSRSVGLASVLMYNGCGE